MDECCARARAVAHACRAGLECQAFITSVFTVTKKDEHFCSLDMIAVQHVYSMPVGFPASAATVAALSYGLKVLAADTGQTYNDYYLSHGGYFEQLSCPLFIHQLGASDDDDDDGQLDISDMSGALIILALLYLAATLIAAVQGLVGCCARATGTGTKAGAGEEGEAKAAAGTDAMLQTLLDKVDALVEAHAHHRSKSRKRRGTSSRALMSEPGVGGENGSRLPTSPHWQNSVTEVLALRRSVALRP